MNKIKKYIIILICFIIILLISLLFLFKIIEKNKIQGKPQEQGFEFSDEINNQYKKISSYNDYFRVNKIIKTYYNFIQELDGKTEDFMILETENGYKENQSIINQYVNEQKEQTKKALFGMLGKEYIEEFDVTLDNIEKKLNSYKVNDFIINDIYQAEVTKNINIFFVYGNKVIQSKLEPFCLMITIDNKNNTFSLYLEDYINKHKFNQYKLGEEVKIPITNIEDRKYNKTKYVSVGSNEIAQKYFENYKKMLQYDSEELFNKLEPDYKIKKFGTLQNFNKYISTNKQKLQNSNITKYSKQINEGITQYICVDQNGKYYIFRETSVMDYTVILDTYTIDLPEFTQKYNASSDEDKLLLNIQKFFAAIDDGDYRYAYNKLDNTYKNTNFKTQLDFENYVKKNFFAKNSLTTGKMEKQGDVYLYTISISDATGKTSNSITKRFVMQLKEGTDFVMSFNLK